MHAHMFDVRNRLVGPLDPDPLDWDRSFRRLPHLGRRGTFVSRGSWCYIAFMLAHSSDPFLLAMLAMSCPFATVTVRAVGFGYVQRRRSHRSA